MSIEPKKKPCKGTHTDTRGLGCGAPTYHRVLGLGKMCGCYSDFILNTEAGKIRLDKATLKAKTHVSTETNKKWNKTKKTVNAKSKDKLQDQVNRIVRLIDNGLPCLAKEYHPKQMHAGHIFSRGSERGIRYNLHNIHRQSAQSNHFQNEDGLLREKLKKEYGVPYYNFISGLRRFKGLKFTDDEYYSVYLKARKIANRLEKQGFQYSLLDRIRLRNEINKELGIYPDELSEYVE